MIFKRALTTDNKTITKETTVVVKITLETETISPERMVAASQQ